MNPLFELQSLGQSVWYDNIRRALIDSGQLAGYVERYAVTGVTANPTIFERAISGSDDYDDALREAVERGVEDPEEVFWELAVRDVRDAADVLRDVYDATGGTDGFVSLELPPRLTHDTDGAVQLATELFDRLDRPNVMIKVVGTGEGVPAVEELTYRGVNVNITLLFSLGQWEAVAEAYARGLERRLDERQKLDVASVASFFISRIDAKANQRLPRHLHNRLGVANAHLAYAAWRRWLSSDRWKRLAEAGARPQRLLWASTSTKDPELAEGFYVTALAAPDTVNTMPEQTMVAFASSGEVGETLSPDASEAEAVAAAAAAEGVDLEELGG
ncbi:MAG: transaldolase, partial [Actinomycetota bacterium]|nr:transaldolase [Actinomycetota bacterium]